MDNITPVYEIPISKLKLSEISSDGFTSSSLAQSVGGGTANADSTVYGQGDEVFIQSSKGIQLGSADFSSAPFSVTRAGALKATTGTFSGALSGATGTFSGELTAGSINIPNSSTANSFHTDIDGNSWWGCTTANFIANNENAIAYILKNGNAKFSGTLNVYGTTRLNDTLTLGSSSLQRSGKLVLEYYPSEGDTYIRCGKTDYGDNTNGFIIGIDQSDSGGVKAEFGDASNYVKILPTGIFIRSNNADLTGSSTIAGKLTTVLIAQVDTKEEVILRAIEGVEEEEITRADGTIVDIVQSMPSTGTPVYVTDFSMYGKDITKDLVFEFEYSMSTSETGHVVKLQADYNVILESATVKPSAFTGTVSQEFTVLNDADYKEILETVGGTLVIPHTDFTASTNLVQIRISRINTGTSGTNHGGSFRLHRVRAYMVTPTA